MVSIVEETQIVKKQKEIKVALDETPILKTVVLSLMMMNDGLEFEKSALGLAQGMHKDAPVIMAY